MAVITIAVCDEVRKDAQKLVKKLSELIPEAELLVYRKRESLLKGLKDEHKRCDVLFMGLDGEKGESLETVRAIRLGGNYVPVVLVAANDHFYKEAFEKNLIKIKDWSKYTLITPILETIDCSLNDMRKIQAKAFMKFYLRPHYIIRQFLQDGPYLLKTIFGVIKTALSKTPKNTDYNKRELKNM